LIRFTAALILSKLIRTGLHILGRRASYLPGAAALKVCPDFLVLAGKSGNTAAVTGTNGKTTVSNLIRDSLRSMGKSVMGNTLGSNTEAGIAAAYAQSVSLKNKNKFDFAILEVDERFTPKVLPKIHPDIFAVTNLFRDSIMRNAHPEFIKSFLDKAILAEASRADAAMKLVLNADDPISAGVGPEALRVYFGIERMDSDITECKNLINDFRVCPICGAEVVYEYRRYHHIGKCYCPDCGFKPPDYTYSGSEINLSDMTMTISFGAEHEVFTLPNDSVFNIYNVLSAAAVIHELGFSLAETAAALKDIKILESRYQETEQDGVRVIMQMSKDRNALASSRAVDYVGSRAGRKELILMMNNYTDEKKWSENTCWLYDCDFEFLNKPDIERIVVTGPRFKDYYLRLLLAGIPEERIRCSPCETEAPALLDLRGADIYILYGTDGIDIANNVRCRVFAEARRRLA